MRVTFGGNTFESDGGVTVLGTDDTGSMLIGGFGPPPKYRLIWVDFGLDGPMLNVRLTDRDGNPTLVITNNVLAHHNAEMYRVAIEPIGQIPPNRVTVSTQEGHTALEVFRHGGAWEINCDIVLGSNRIVATPNGLTFNP